MNRSFVALLLAFATLSISRSALAADVFGPIRIGANRSRYVGACPVEVIFTGNINLNSPHPRGFSFNYYWIRSDGAKSPISVVKPSPSQNMLIVKEPWTIGAAGQHYDLSVKLYVNSGNTHVEQASQEVSVTCR
jgi:lipopolysaccharide export system protein LptA